MVSWPLGSLWKPTQTLLPRAGRGVPTPVKEKGRSEGKASWKGSAEALLSRDAFITCLAATCLHLFIFLFSERILHQQILLKRFYLTCRRILCASDCLLKSLGRLRGKSAAMWAICIGQVASCCQYAQATWPCTQPSVPLWPAGSNLAAFQGLGAPKAWAVLFCPVASGSHSHKLCSHTDQWLTNAHFQRSSPFV